ncbi:MAG: dCTP deaminase [candidate division Zixibacteria bacterium]|nr:dCTP deaminase [candidate division Zixibacteria bacterium]MCK4427407.1 dCTP deaminase [candidate division Zixibacteria bacterium]
MILSDNDIREFIDSGDIAISPFNGELEPASYDLRVSKEGLSKDGAVNIEEKGYIKIPRGATAVIYPLERIKLTTRVVARYGLRSRFARKGLILLSGPQIDPGFEGTLSVTIFNAGTSEVTLQYQEKFATIEFFLLKTPASKGYDGPYQRQTKIGSDEIELITRKYKNFSEIEDVLTRSHAQLGIINIFIYVVLFGTIAGIVGGVIIVILAKLVELISKL